MKIDNHIAKRFLTDPSMAVEIIEYMYPNANEVFGLSNQYETAKTEYSHQLELTQEELKDRIAGLYDLLSTPKTHKPYYCTESMLSCLDLLKINKIGDHYNWTYFSTLKDQKATFIFPNNSLLRMHIDGEIIWFLHMEFQPDEDKIRGNMKWVMFYLNRKTGELCEHFGHKDVQRIEKFIYSLLCFVYLADNEEVLVAANSKHGTRKSGKLINSTPFPMIIITSKWNITAIRTEGFSVSPHFAVRYTGKGRTVPRVVFIDQFEKKGYIRKEKPDGFENEPIADLYIAE